MNEWLIFAFTTAIFSSFAVLMEKKTLKTHHAAEFSFVLSFFILLFTLPLWFYIDYSSITPLAIAIMYIMSVFASGGFLLIAKATRHLDVSMVSPITVISPAVFAFLAFIFLGEVLNIFQIIGIILMIIGLYILESHKHEKFFEPFVIMFKSKFLLFVLIAILLYAFSSLFERTLYIKMGISPMSFIPIIHLFLFANFLFLVIFKHYGVASVINNFRHSWQLVFFMAIIVLVHRGAFAISLSLAPVAAIVPVIKRLSALISTVIGGEFFHEKGLFKKAISCIIMLLGVIFVML